MSTPAENYLHGFTPVEQERLYDQAQFLEDMTYSGIDLHGVKHLLEVGCGVGAQTEILLRRFPHLHITGIDFSEAQLAVAQQRRSNSDVMQQRTTLLQMDAKAMRFEDAGTFDGAFLCWVLEHIPGPQQVISELKRVLLPGSVVYITEVNNATFHVEPSSPATMRYWHAFNELQQSIGGDPFAGAKLGNLLHEAGFEQISTNIKTFFYDKRQPEKRSSMFQYCLSLLLSASENLLAAGSITTADVDAMKNELMAATANNESVFYYSFIQARALTPGKAG